MKPSRRPRRRYRGGGPGIAAAITVWLLIRFLKLLGLLIAAAAVVAVWPVSVTAGLGYLAAWLRGWHPTRLYRIAAWAIPYEAAWLAAAALRARRWQDLALAPVRAWQAGSLDLLHARIPQGLYVALLPAFPLGMLAAGAGWAWWSALVMAGRAGRTEFAPVIHDERKWRRQVKAARSAVRAPGLYPLATRGGGVPAGAVIRVAGHRPRQVLVIPAALFARQMVVIGSTGTGKTNLLIRLLAGWYAAKRREWLRDQARAGAAAAKGGGKKRQGREAGRPLVVILDCKGGADSRAKAKRVREVLAATGARTVATWPDDRSLSVWTGLEPADLAVFLHQLLPPAAGNAAYYADMSQAIIRLAVLAPAGPPRSAEEFLSRLDQDWLAMAYAGGTRAQRAAAAGAGRHAGDVQARYQVLLARLGPELDGHGQLTDADAWYVILEGTRDPSVAEAQAMAFTALIARAATGRDGEPRQILFIADDYSAVSGRVPVWQLYERGRALDLAVIVSAQSWEGLGATEDERLRITSTADGGIWLLKTSRPQKITELAGTVQRLEAARKLIGAAFGDEGTSRIQHAWTVPPDRIRRLKTGQACYIRDGAAVYVQVARARPSPVRWPLPPARTRARPKPVIIPPSRPAPDDQDGRDGRGDGGGQDRPGPPRQRQPGTVPGHVLDDVLGPDPRDRP